MAIVQYDARQLAVPGRSFPGTPGDKRTDTPARPSVKVTKRVIQAKRSEAIWPDKEKTG